MQTEMHENGMFPVVFTPLCNLSALSGLHSIQLLYALEDSRRCPVAGARLPVDYLDGGVVVDGGTSRDAEDALAWAHRRPNWTVVGYEASQRECQRAEWTVAKSRAGAKPQIMCRALSSQEGNTSFMASGEQQGSLHPIHTNALSRNVTIVQATTLDTIFPKPQHIFLLKLDLQGGEHEALLGGINLLREYRIAYLYIEFDPFLLHRASTSADALLNLLKSHRFTCVNFRRKSYMPWLCNTYRRDDGGKACWTNLLCSVDHPDDDPGVAAWPASLISEYCRVQRRAGAVACNATNHIRYNSSL